MPQDTLNQVQSSSASQGTSPSSAPFGKVGRSTYGVSANQQIINATTPTFGPRDTKSASNAYTAARNPQTPKPPKPPNTPQTTQPTAARSVGGHDMTLTNQMNQAAEDMRATRLAARPNQPSAQIAQPETPTQSALPDWMNPQMMEQLQSIFGGNSELGNTGGGSQVSALPPGLNPLSVQRDTESAGGLAALQQQQGLPSWISPSPYRGNDTSRLANDPFTVTQATRDKFR